MTEDMRAANGLRQSLEDLPGSLIRHVAEPNMGKEDLLKLWFGEPDVPTPQFIKDAATAALDDNQVFYAQNRGVPELRKAISEYASNLHGRDIGIDRLTVTGSGMNAIMMISEALMSSGDNMVAVGPVWPNCKETVRIMDAEPRQVALRLGNDGRWKLDIDELFAACDDRTRAVFVNSPGNPTGWVMPREEQRALMDECRTRGIWLIADEVYIRLAYESDLPLGRAPSFLDIAEPHDRLIVINSFSKSWSMTGWRLGWITHPIDAGEAFEKLVEYNIANPTTFVQYAGITAIRDGEDFIAETLERYRRNRDIVVQRLGAMKRVTLSRPEGAFYAFFAVEGITDSVAFAQQLIDDVGVGLAPGLAFSEDGEGWMRLCFSAGTATVSAAMDRLEPVLG
ncbi:MAG: pyridoxal phosphate-dependent aminotransferase [Pseudomonadota bacterium]|nr:pyridoxal phosphate-dependent aminotransferase [Pseudomonadota bacterium]|tara:strand:+ start:198 stop:1385 length:1188 start_codon:yes stop_codon:yes gene_type:complete